MPQDGSNNYYYPPGTPGIPDQTIESEAYNTFLNDLVNNDLNIPRPVHRGGTGANNAAEAMATLGGELASQSVSNFDSHLWVPGSFRSLASATGSPIAGHAFTGIVYSSDAPQTPPLNQNVILHARDLSDGSKPGRIYIREKKAGVWDTWRGEDRIVVSPTPPSLAITPDGGLWWDNENGILYILYNDGNSTAWVQVTAVPFVDVEAFVKKSGDTMLGPLNVVTPPTAAAHAASKAYVDGGVDGVTGGLNSKAGLEALAYSGMQINGSMEVNQPGVSVTIPSGAAAAYVMDGWLITKTGTSVLQGLQGGTAGLSGFVSSLAFHTTTVQATMGADFVRFYTRIEGYRTSRLAWGTASARPVTVGFWILLPVAGTYRAMINNFDASATTPWMTFAVAAADTWQWVTITFAPITTGTWKTDNGIGMLFAIEVASSATPNTVAATGKFCQLTGFILLPGIYAPTAAQSPLIMRPYGEELLTCQRYYWQLTGTAPGVPSAFAVGSFFSVVLGLAYIKYPQAMRSAPTFAMEGAVRMVSTGTALTTGSVVASPSDVYSVRLDLTTSGATVGAGFIVDAASAATRIKFDARL